MPRANLKTVVSSPLRNHSSYLQKLVNQWRSHHFIKKIYEQAPTLLAQWIKEDPSFKVCAQKLETTDSADFYLASLNEIKAIERGMRKYTEWAIIIAHKRYDKLSAQRGWIFPPSEQSRGINLFMFKDIEA